MDTATGDIRAVEFTSSDKGDSPVLPHLLDQVPRDERIGTVTGDGSRLDCWRGRAGIMKDIAVAYVKKGYQPGWGCPCEPAATEGRSLE